MSELVVRRLLIDLESPIARHWCAGDAFRTAWFNALSMSFPLGEQFFIDSVRDGFRALPPEKQEAMRENVQGFIGQEATHRRIHALFNDHLYAQGLVNRWEPSARKRLKAFEGRDPRHAVAATAGNEHLTAIMCEWLLNNTEVVGEEARMRTMWLWHCAEELEHKDVAFDVYQALGGNHRWRVFWLHRITFIFLLEASLQTLSNLKHDGTLWRWSTWRSAWSLLFGEIGGLRKVFGPWKAYLKKDFHPRQQGSGKAEQWLAQNAAQFRVVERAM